MALVCLLGFAIVLFTSREMKEERAELYKTQGTNAQRLLDLNDILRLKDATLAQNKEE